MAEVRLEKSQEATFKKGEIPLGKLERWLDNHCVCHVQNRPISQLVTVQHLPLVASPTLSLWPSLLKRLQLVWSYFDRLKNNQRDCLQNGSVRFSIWKVTLTKSSGKNHWHMSPDKALRPAFFDESDFTSSSGNVFLSDYQHVCFTHSCFLLVFITSSSYELKHTPFCGQHAFCLFLFAIQRGGRVFKHMNIKTNGDSREYIRL